MSHAILYIGTFNPIHIGHKFIIYNLSKLYPESTIIVSPEKVPLNDKDKVLSYETRVDLVKEFLNNSFLENVVYEEIKLKYAYEIVSYYKQCYDRVSYVIGEDNFWTFPAWTNFKQIVSELDDLIVFFRDSVCKSKVYDINVVKYDTTIVISSTKVRELILQEDYKQAEFLTGIPISTLKLINLELKGDKMEKEVTYEYPSGYKLTVNFAEGTYFYWSVEGCEPVRKASKEFLQELIDLAKRDGAKRVNK